jgi:hypothetical protein
LTVDDRGLMSVRANSIAVLTMFLLGCSSGAEPRDGGGTGASGTTGAGGSDGRGGTTGNAGRGGGGMAGTGSSGTSGNPCASATPGDSCSDEGRSCGSCNDACNFCNLTMCIGGRWTRVEVAPAPCFECGASLRCQISAQYCIAELPGVPTGVTSYSCASLPDSCRPTPTCACLQIGGGTCQSSGSGQLTVTLAPP